MPKLLNKTLMVKRMRIYVTDWKKIFATPFPPKNSISDKGLLSKTYKQLLKLNNEKMNNPI